MSLTSLSHFAHLGGRAVAGTQSVSKTMSQSSSLISIQQQASGGPTPLHGSMMGFSKGLPDSGVLMGAPLLSEEGQTLS